VPVGYIISGRWMASSFTDGCKIARQSTIDVISYSPQIQGYDSVVVGRWQSRIINLMLSFGAFAKIAKSEQCLRRYFF